MAVLAFGGVVWRMTKKAEHQKSCAPPNSNYPYAEDAVIECDKMTFP